MKNKLDCGCTWEHACDFHRTHSAYQGTKDHGSLPIDFKIWKKIQDNDGKLDCGCTREKTCDFHSCPTNWEKLDEIIERLGSDVPYHFPEPTFNYFKFGPKHGK